MSLVLPRLWMTGTCRGGGEYGEEWHKAGTLSRKQNVFDDFMAAARHLAEEGYVTSKQLAIMGGSNGGLVRTEGGREGEGGDEGTVSPRTPPHVLRNRDPLELVNPRFSRVPPGFGECDRRKKGAELRQVEGACRCRCPADGLPFPCHDPLCSVAGFPCLRRRSDSLVELRGTSVWRLHLRCPLLSLVGHAKLARASGLVDE